MHVVVVTTNILIYHSKSVIHDLEENGAALHNMCSVNVHITCQTVET